jgi:arylsulfatase A-like enzyme
MDNVILVTVDTLRKDMVGFYQNPQPVSFTPFLDTLKAGTVLFEHAYSCGPYTQAAFPAILSSAYFLEHGRQKKLPRENTLVSEVLQREGIKTAGFHSNPYLSYFFGYNRGWDMFYDSMQDDVSKLYPFVRGGVINQKVGVWLESFVKKGANAPLFIWVHYMDVHEPYVPSEKYLAEIDPSLALSKEQMFGLYKEVLLQRDCSDPETVRVLASLYRAKVLETDGHIKSLFRIFGELGVLDDSLVIVTSDHGEEFGEHGGLSHDGKMVPELINVPLLIYAGEKRSDELPRNVTANEKNGDDTGPTEGPAGFSERVSSADIPPTILDLFGIEMPPSYRGASLVGIETEISGAQSGTQCRSCFGQALDKTGSKEKETDMPIHYLVRNNVKTVYREREEAFHIYDLENDPEEKTDLAADSEILETGKHDILDFLQTLKNGRT